MKIYAKQVPPEFQDTEWMVDCDFYKENIVLIKNSVFPQYGNHIDDFKRAEDNCEYSDWASVKILFQLYTGKVWERTTICGYNQCEWQTCLYCPSEISIDELHSFESYYFNAGTEYEIYINKPRGEINSNIYCTSFDVKDEIAKIYGVEENDVVIYEFVGYKKIPQYKVVK